MFDETIDSGSFVIGMSGNLQPVATRDETTNLTNNGLAYWNSTESRFDTNSLYTLDTLATDTNLVAISGNLQSQITSNDVDISLLQSQTTTISGDLDTLELQVNNLDLTYATDADLVNVSGNLQAQITSNDVDISLLQSQTTTISGDLDTLEISVGANTSAITLNKDDITILQSQTTTISGDLDSLEQQFADLDLTYATDADLVNVSGNLQAQIITNDVDILGLVGISGDHETRIFDLETQTNGISGGLTQLDDRFVNVDGDTMTGTLTISGANLNVTDLITDEENVAQIDDLGNLITSELQELYVPVEDVTSDSATGIKGQWSFGLGFYYKCVATNTWIKISSITSF